MKIMSLRELGLDVMTHVDMSMMGEEKTPARETLPIGGNE